MFRYLLSAPGVQAAPIQSKASEPKAGEPIGLPGGGSAGSGRGDASSRLRSSQRAISRAR
jgi:hypothetical protein